MDPLINHNNSSASPRQKTRFVVNKGIVESRRSYLQRHDATNINLSFIIPCLSLYLSTYHSQSVCLLFFLFVSPFFHSLNCHCFVLSSQHFNILSIHIDVLLTFNLFLHTLICFLIFFPISFLSSIPPQEDTQPGPFAPTNLICIPKMESVPVPVRSSFGFPEVMIFLRAT